MEEFIIYVIIVLSIIINIYRNFQKQKKEDATRQISNPAKPSPVTSGIPSANKKPQQKQAKAISSKKVKKTALETAMESLENENQSTLYNYSSLETAQGYNNYLDERKNFYSESDIFGDLKTIDEEMKDGMAEETTAPALSLFGSQDEIKKAIIYTSVFERKY